MTKTRIGVLVIVAIVLSAFPGFSAAPAGCTGLLCAGAARADITPPVTTPMWGYLDRYLLQGGKFPWEEPPTGRVPTRWLDQHTRSVDTDLYQKGYFLRSEGFHTRLYARALVIRNAAGTEVALVQVDLGAMTGEVWRAVAQQVAPLGIARDRLLISATHTHGGPGAIQQPVAHALIVGDNYDPRVVKRVVDGIVKAITRAHERLAPSRVAIGHGSIIGASQNRSHIPHLANACPDPAAIDDGSECNHQAANHEDSLSPHAIDPTVTMIRADRIDGVPLGVWTSFAAHGTVFGAQLLFTGDNQGVAERLVEQGIRTRAAAQGIALPSGWQIVAAYANGTEGDIAPHCTGYNDFACAEQGGTLQAERVLSLYDSLESKLRDDIVLDARLDVLYMNGEGGTSPVGIYGSGPDCPLGKPPLDQPPFNDPIPGQGRKCPLLVLSGTGPQWFWIQTLRIGDYVLADVPGEMSVQMGRRVRQRILSSPANRDASGNAIVHHAIVVGLANDYMSYLVTPEEYDFQWYEAQFTLWGRNEGPLMADRMGALADRMLTGLPAPSFVEPPDTSWTQAENVSPVTQAASVAPAQRAPGTPLVQPWDVVRRGEVATFSWVGGQPSAELTPDETFVGVQRLSGDAWETVFTDEGLDDITDYVREGVEDRWSDRWDVPLDATAGTYRFAVTGKAYVGGTIRPYELTSEAFDVSPNESVVVTGARLVAAGVLVTAAYPQPDPGVNFRLRQEGPTSGTVAIVLARADGSEVRASGVYDPAAGAYVVALTAAPGDSVSVFPGDLVDAAGNTNSTSFTEVL